ncbi:diaminopimelate decarboxylase [Marinobacterium arenosum]|uniref:diaminopimelate decarboxylase n=1 Tax=Marinobacterium arenosum TaxID=2862496 RepID=UPI001C946021|nr:diaminopimelate decarboxylase [Marinobacterium arenosum]MBY4678956.1 diaminopimelate decarboxylase [Marinobacterium arenosum]
MQPPLAAEFHYQHDRLTVEQVDLTQLADQLGTPCYIYSTALLQRRIAECRVAFESRNIAIHYAMKANSNLSLLHLVAEQGLGVDIVSGGELQRALRAGFAPQKIVFSGVGKSIAELSQALDAGVGQINIESAEEFALLRQLAEHRQQPVNLALRVNPEVQVDTHRHITTGSSGNKFGVPLGQAAALFRQAADSEYLNLRGLAIHIGSQIRSSEPYQAAITKLCALARQLQADGHPVELLDLGGGFGIDDGSGQALGFAEIAEVIINTVTESCSGFSGRIAVEPGRSLVAECGLLLSRVNYVKAAEPRPFLILDAGMNDLMRPALYQAQHPLLPVRQPTTAEQRRFELVGPVCESTDTFARDYPFTAEVKAGDLVAFSHAGAYSAVMCSTYNGRDLIPEVLVDGEQARLIRRRIDVQQMMAFEENGEGLIGV